MIEVVCNHFVRNKHIEWMRDRLGVRVARDVADGFLLVKIVFVLISSAE